MCICYLKLQRLVGAHSLIVHLFRLEAVKGTYICVFRNFFHESFLVMFGRHLEVLVSLLSSLENWY